MTNIRSFTLFLLAMLVVLGAWQWPQSKVGIVKLKIDARTQQGEDTRIIDYNRITGNKLGGIKLDAQGKGSFSFELGSARFLSIEIGELSEEVFLTPGDELIVSLTGPGNYTFQYKGRGAVVNNYISLQNGRLEYVKMFKGNHLRYVKPELFMEGLDTVKKAIAAFHKAFSDTTTLGADVKTMLERRNTIKIASVVQDYACVQKVNAFGAGIKVTFPHEVDALIKSMPFDTVMLGLGQPDYRRLLESYIQHDIYLPMYKNGPREQPAQRFPTAAARQIAQDNYPYKFAEYLSALNVLNRMSAQGLTPSTDSAFNAFKVEYAASRFVSSLEKRRDHLLLVAKDKPAINFTGVNPQGDSVSLDMFRGKVVYVDVWATWCGGCIQEIPSSIGLQQQYKNKVVFLNVSTDRDAVGWRNMLARRSDWQGIHMLNNGSIMQRYGFSALPRYLLIDSKGKIISADAPRPSSPDIRKVIDAALQ